MKDRRYYIIASAVTFIAEVVIATCVHDNLVRPHVGDSLAVLFVFFVVRAFTPLTVLSSIVAALALACAIEFGQLYGLLAMLNLQHDMFARTLLGTGFDPKDFLAYGMGGTAAWLGESFRYSRKTG